MFAAQLPRWVQFVGTIGILLIGLPLASVVSQSTVAGWIVLVLPAVFFDRRPASVGGFIAVLLAWLVLFPVFLSVVYTDVAGMLGAALLVSAIPYAFHWLRGVFSWQIDLDEMATEAAPGVPKSAEK